METEDWGSGSDTRTAGNQQSATNNQKPATPPAAGVATAPLPAWRACVAAVLILATGLACVFVPPPQHSTEAGVIMRLPHAIGDYWGIDAAVGPRERATLPPDTEYARKTYSSVTGPELLCSIILAGATKSSIHRPEVCLPAQGVSVKGSRAVRIPIGDGRFIPARLLTTQNLLPTRDGGAVHVPSLFLYWFVARDTMTDSHYRRHIISAWDRIFRNRNQRWAYVLVAPTHPERYFAEGGFTPEIGLPAIEAFVRAAAPTFLKPEVFP